MPNSHNDCHERQKSNERIQNEAHCLVTLFREIHRLLILSVSSMKLYTFAVFAILGGYKIIETNKNKSNFFYGSKEPQI